MTPDASSGVIISDIPSETPWWTPRAWFGSPVWDFGAELGINGAEGNSQSLNILTAFNGKRTTEGNLLEWDLKYSKTQTTVSKHRISPCSTPAGIGTCRRSGFSTTRISVEYDEFKAFDLRLVLSGGLGTPLDEERTDDIDGAVGCWCVARVWWPDDEWIPEANFGLDFEHKLPLARR